MSLFFCLYQYMWNAYIFVTLYVYSYWMLSEKKDLDEKEVRNDNSYLTDEPSRKYLMEISESETNNNKKLDIKNKKVVSKRKREQFARVDEMYSPYASQDSVQEAAPCCSKMNSNQGNNIVETRLNVVRLFETMVCLGPRLVSKTVYVFMKETMSGKIETFLEYLSTRPVLTLPIFALLMFVGVPIGIFILLAVATTVFTFVGFLMIEGTIIGVAAFIAGSCLLTIFGFVFVLLLGLSVVRFSLQKVRILKRCPIE